MPPSGDKPAVVIDLNVLQGQPTSKLKLNEDFEYVIADTMGPEILDKSSDDLKKLAKKIAVLIQINHSAISFGLPLGNIFAKELKKQKPIHFLNCFDAEYDKSIQSGSINEAVIEQNFLNGHVLRSDMADYRKSKEIWTETLTENATDTQSTKSNKEILKKAENDIEIEKEMIMHNDAIWRVLSTSYSASPVWRNRVSDPDSLWSSALIGRLIHYCSVQHMLGKTANTDNNHDDIEYSFYAIHTGHLATHDNGLIRMSRMCSTNDIVVHDSIFE